MSDPTEMARRERLAEINAEPGSRAALEARYGPVWTTDELADDLLCGADHLLAGTDQPVLVHAAWFFCFVVGCGLAETGRSKVAALCAGFFPPFGFFASRLLRL